MLAQLNHCLINHYYLNRSNQDNDGNDGNDSGKTEK